jgi:hypothetical protein
MSQMTENSVSLLATAARAHVDALRAELDNTQTRDQYIRLTVLTLEADRIATALECFK